MRDSAEASPRVLVFVPQYPYPVVGGLERQSHELSKALAGLGLQIRVLSGKITPGQPDFEEVEGISVTRLKWFAWRPLRFGITPFSLLFHLWRQRNEYDVLHLHQYSWVGLYLIVAARLLGKPVLTKLPNVGVFGIPGLQKKRLGKLRLAILLRSSAIVAMSEASVRELIEVGYPRKRMLTVPNGISHRITQEQSFAGRYADHGICRVVFAGRLAKQKCLDVLLNAWVKVDREFPNRTRLELWGSGPLEDELKSLSRDLEIDQSVVFKGYLQDVATRLRNSDIFVLPSMTEGNSNAILEAMEAGLPVVATRVGGTAMQVGPEGAPLLFSVGDHESLSEKLITLIREPHFRRAAGMAMSDRIGQFFDLRKIAASYICAYRELAFSAEVDLVECAELPTAGKSEAI